ncbi:MAG TPA: VIT1/CCC1 transporter family protein [Candidatus Eremiobacteraceae bacterium]
MKRQPIPRRAHIEEHFTASSTVRDIVIGMSDGLTVPFALAAGISGAIAASHIVLTAGVAELAAGGIAMGLGGYLAARSDVEHYASERRREAKEIDDVPDEERAEIEAIIRSYGVQGDALRVVTTAITSDKERWIEFMMRFELGLEKPNAMEAPMSALRIGGSYVVGGVLPLAPYVAFADAGHALPYSIGVTMVALFIFGAVKGNFTGVSWARSALQTTLIGGIAAAVAFFCARLIA